MGKGRLEAFSDGVIAVIITIMVLELHLPHGDDLAALRELTPVFLSYVLSFVFIGIYWNNHHHMLHATTRVNGKVLWANLHLLFWLSLVPFTTGWIGEHHEASIPTAVYGAVLLASSVAYLILSKTIIATEGPDSKLGAAVGSDRKGMLSSLLYAIAIPVAFLAPLVSDIIYVAIAATWFVPDRRIESRLHP